MSKYLLFGFYDYYPSGGMNDLITEFDSYEEISDIIMKDENDYAYERENYQAVNTKDFSYNEFKVETDYDIDDYDIDDYEERIKVKKRVILERVKEFILKSEANHKE